MKANNTASEIPHPPLARDAAGNLLPVPTGTAAWRICRHTDGRPRIIKGPDRQPARFSLDTTIDDVVDACGPDRYHIYALDAVGEVIAHVTTLDAGLEPRNAAEPAITVLPAPRAPVPGGDWRYALETIAQIARTNAEAMRAVAESQAEWIKSISSARGFFRNAPQLKLPPAEPKNDEEEDDDVEDDDEDEDELDEEDREMDWVSMLQPVVATAAQSAVNALINRFMGGGAPTSGNKIPFELADMFNWNRIAKKREQAQQAAAPEPAVHPAPAAPMLQDLDPKALQQALMGKAMAINSLLTPAERTRLFQLAPKLTKHMQDPDVLQMMADLIPMSVEDAAVWVRTHLDEIETRLAS
jgi:hypothetical protein